MAQPLNGKDGAIKVGATSAASVGNAVSWTLPETHDEYTQKPLGQDYTGRVTGHSDWVATLEVDLDNADTQLANLLSVGAAATVWLYTDEDNAKGKTGTGVITGVNYAVAGTALNHVSVTVGGNSALSDIS